MAAVNKAFSVLVSLCVLLTLASANRHLTEKKAGVLDRKEVEPQGVGVGIGVGSGPREGSRSGVDCGGGGGGGGSVIQIPGISIGMPGGPGCGGVPQIPYPIYVPGPGGCPPCTPAPPCMPGFGQDQPGGAGAAKVDAHDQQMQQPIATADQVVVAAAKEDAVKTSTATPGSN